MRDVELAFAFADTGAVHGALAQFDAQPRAHAFDAAGTVLRVQVPAAAFDALKAHLRDATRDRVRVSSPDACPSPAPARPA